MVRITRGLTREQFRCYLHGLHGSRGQLQQETNALMASIGAPMNLREYDAQDFLPIVIDRWNVEYAGRYVFKGRQEFIDYKHTNLII
jgi:hypothetical protein